MIELVDKFRTLPGGFSNINPFDVVYSAISVGLVGLFGRTVPLLDRLGLSLDDKWQPGKPLKILLLAYSGARNTGAESRVGECIRQLNQLFGEDNIEINMLTLDVAETEEYFKGYKAKFHHMNSVFFLDVFKHVLKNHVIVLPEGSCWKENFATALLLYFLYGVGLADRLGKASFSYSVEAGEMNRLNNFLSWHLSRDMTRIITRSQPSADVLERIGLQAHSVRVDTAWTMPCQSSAWARSKLKEMGWDGKKPLCAFAFQNYFWWPVVPDLARFARSLATGDTKNQYKLVYFYDYDEEDERRFAAFVDDAVEIMDWLAEEKGAQPVLVAMEALDHDACQEVIGRMKNPALLVSCHDWVGDQMAAFLRELHLLMTTRYHAMVLSMPGKVPFVGVSRDERIKGVMGECDLEREYYVDFRTPDLARVVERKVERLLDDADERKRVRKVINDNLPYYFAQMAMLGLDLRNMIREEFPGFPLIELDEDDPLELIPDCPKGLMARTKARFKKLKRAELG